ncbi:MAG TPA: proline dehydrogenase family protein, partial [Burkholderiaceae bacterium]|nr:proline dehydrogenase family protein [Burkholderiaceae bacterium]
MEVTRTLTGQGLLVALDLLGENAVHKSDAEKATLDYLAMLEKIRQSEQSCYISLKLTQLGLDQGNEVAIVNLSRILEAAKTIGLFVRIDMEGSKYTEQTVEV